MGIIWTKLRDLLFGRKLELALVGLENSGKTTFANHLAYGEPKKTLPTFGVNVRFVKKKSKHLEVNYRLDYEDLGPGGTVTIQTRMATICKILRCPGFYGRCK